MRGTKVKRYVLLNDKTLEYILEYKKVKNTNLRIKEGKVYVSANRRVPISQIEDFMKSKANFIENAVNKTKNVEKKELYEYFTLSELKSTVEEICKKHYPYFKERCKIPFPNISYKEMVSRWGSCNYINGKITLNTKLLYVPYECVEYVVLHEFCHFLQPNHSKMFYFELEKVCPRHKEYRAFMKNIPTR